MLAMAAARGRYRGQAGRTDSNAHRHTHTYVCSTCQTRSPCADLHPAAPAHRAGAVQRKGEGIKAKGWGEDEGLNSKKMHTKETEVSKGNERKENEPKQRFGYSAERRDGQIQETTGPEGASSNSLSVRPKQSP